MGHIIFVAWVRCRVWYPIDQILRNCIVKDQIAGPPLPGEERLGLVARALKLGIKLPVSGKQDINMAPKL